MFRPRPCRARVSALVTVFLVALSLCVSSLSPFVRASVADDHVRAAEVALASADVAAGTRNVSDGVSADVEVSVTATRVKMNDRVPVIGAHGLPETLDEMGTFRQGDHLLYAITLHNKGAVPVTGLSVFDELPVGVEYISSQVRLCQESGSIPCVDGVVNVDAPYDKWTHVWSAMPSNQPGTHLEVGGTITLYFLVRVDWRRYGWTITNTATLRDYDQVDADLGNNSASASFVVGGLLAGQLYNDQDASWSREETERAIEGVLVRLLDVDGNPVKDKYGEAMTRWTDSGGRYEFEYIPLGSYKIEVVPGPVERMGQGANLEDWRLTYAYGSSTDRSQFGEGKLITPDAIELTPDTPAIEHVDFAFVEPLTLGGLVLFDANRDEVREDEESGIEGVTVSIFDEDGNPAIDVDGRIVQPVVTDENGRYKFQRMTGGYYKTVYSAPRGYRHVRDWAWHQEPGNPSSGWITFHAPISLDNVDIYLTADGTIGGTVFWDVNRSGGDTLDDGDKALSGVNVTMSYSTPAGVKKTASTVTGVDGSYSFADLAPVDYVVTVDQESLAAACPQCNAQTHSPAGVLPAAEGQALALSATIALRGDAMVRDDQDWAFAVAPEVPVDPAPADPAPADPTPAGPVAPADPVPADPEAPAVDGGGSAVQPSASGNQTHVPSVNNGPALARTGSDASVLGGMAAMAAIAGFAALAGKRRREREDA